MGKYLFYIQLVLLLLLFYLGDLGRLISSGFLTIPFAAGTVLGLWAFYNMGSEGYSPFPEPKKDGKIVQKGAYKYIRHPMYAGLLLVAISLLFTSPNIISFIVFAVFTYIIDEKAGFEENLLIKIHGQYKDYQQKTKKFIPYLY